MITGAEHLDGLVGIMAGPANVVMQLSRPEIGYGMVESTVRRAQLTRHPLRRFRTTFTYLAVAALGDEREQLRLRRALDETHASVRSGPASPISYDAFDPELQLWVAACLYRGAEDVAALAGESLGHDFYQQASVFATMLQVHPGRWPRDREAFERYWQSGLARIRIDPPVRRYLHDVISLSFLPAGTGAVPGRLNRWVTTGFLAPEFRRAMGLEWSDSDQRRFHQSMRLLATSRRPLPPLARRFPLDWFLADFRLRCRLGLPPI